jgi:predicted nucleic acid-binding protein
VLRGSLSLSVPDLWIYEMLNLLLQADRRGRIPQQAVDQGFSSVQRVPVNAFDLGTPLSRTRVLKLAHRFSLSACDASYLELADRLQAPLLTLDGTLKMAGRTLGLPDLPAFYQGGPNTRAPIPGRTINSSGTLGSNRRVQRRFPLSLEVLDRIQVG